MILWQYPFMLNALALCIVLTIALSSFGHHVVRRGVIFVDLSLAQLAALGASLGSVMGLQERPIAQFALSLLFAMLGAGLFAWFRTRETLPIEALIGLTYAGSLAFCLLILERSASGTEEMKEMLMGSVLTVSTQQVITCLVAGGLTLGCLFLARKPIEQITLDSDFARTLGRNILLWDFLFYASFGVLVTVAVRTAGVLLVFTFLITPSLVGLLFRGSPLRSQLAAWIFGILACLSGMEMSVRWDFSAGPSLVLANILLLGLAGMLRSGWSRLKNESTE